MKQAANAQYSATPARGFVERLLSSQRHKMFDAFMSFKHGAPDGSVLNVCIQPAPPFEQSDYLVAWSDEQARARITSWEVVPTERNRQALRLPYADAAFDWIFCNEVIEHAGSAERQYALVQELYRIARKGIFLTTANRRHPIEFKTALPLIHLLPDAWWRQLLKWFGKRKWASESILNPVDAPALYRFASLLPGKPEHDVGHKRLFGIKAHFFLMIEKRKA